MPVLDTTSILGGYGQSIVNDWALGDDRQFSGDANASPFPPPAGDLALSDAYFTLKKNPIDTDANSILQVHITQAGSASGQITGANLTQLLFKIVSANYEALVFAGQLYYWDVRCITAAGGVTFTVATGTVLFVQNVTQTDKAGTPAAIPFGGQPQFRGFRFLNPQFDSTYNTISNLGDIVFNSIPPVNGSGPVGWQCISPGTPGAWVAFGVLTTTAFTPTTAWTFGSAAPVGGTHALGDIVWNLTPTAGQGVSPNIGWVCVVAGSPGTWKEFGPIGN